eukprot:11017564-Heterocapsa_arctica.AAC.1
MFLPAARGNRFNNTPMFTLCPFMGTRRFTAPPRTRTCGPTALMGPIGTACLPACCYQRVRLPRILLHA